MVWIVGSSPTMTGARVRSLGETRQCYEKEQESKSKLRDLRAISSTIVYGPAGHARRFLVPGGSSVHRPARPSGMPLGNRTPSAYRSAAVPFDPDGDIKPNVCAETVG